MITTHTSFISTDANAQAWPPEDPSNRRAFDFNHDDDDGYELALPTSPWTYENGSINPGLEPSNAFRRRANKTRKSRRTQGVVENVPPYHPDFGKPTTSRSQYSSGSDSEDSDEYRYSEGPRRRIRRGSEGLEVAMGPADREEILRRYILTRGAEAGHYRTYEPEPDSDSPSPTASQSSEGRSRGDKLKAGKSA